MSKRLTKNDFIEKSNIIHLNKYDYSFVPDNIKSHSKVPIFCLVHQTIFHQTPNKHLLGRGCPICKKQTLSNPYISDKSNFIGKANKIHNFKYDYSKVVYINSRTKVCIICPIHGEFWQTANAHIQGSGCPKCHQSKGEIQIEKWLKENKFQFIPQYKFKDCKGLRNYLPFDFYLPELNICIEYDGRQHFEPMINLYGKKAIETFQQTQINDKIKNLYCENHNIKLLRINFKHYKQIEKILETYFI